MSFISRITIAGKVIFTLGFFLLIFATLYSNRQYHNNEAILAIGAWGVLMMIIGIKMTRHQVPTNVGYNEPPIGRKSGQVAAHPAHRFEKIQEIIDHSGQFKGFLLIRTLKPLDDISTLSDREMISDIILSKYHFWEGEKDPNGFVWNVNEYGKEVAVATKAYGFFDNTKIKADHYKPLTFEDFLSRLVAAIEEETGNDEAFIQRAKKSINLSLNKSSTYYYLDLDEEKDADTVSYLNVYDFFYAFLSINKNDGLISLIEFGLD